MKGQQIIRIILIYISNPPFFSNNLYEYYLSNNDRVDFNQFGFNKNNYKGDFKDLNYNKAEIEKIPKFSINTSENLAVFETNTNLFFNMLDHLRDKKSDYYYMQSSHVQNLFTKTQCFYFSKKG